MKINYYFWSWLAFIGILVVHSAEGFDLGDLLDKAKDLVNWNDIQYLSHRAAKKAKEKATCTGCLAGVGGVHALIEANASNERIGRALVTICDGLNIQDKTYCAGLVNSNLDTLIYIIKEKDLGAKKVCGTIFESYECVEHPIVDWTVPLDQYGKKPYKKPVNITTSSYVKIIHITDIHYDADYKVGAKTNCGEPLCCRDNQGKGDATHSAGPLGDYNECDLPYAALEFSLWQIAKTHKDAKIIYVTGDFVPHNVQNITKKQVVRDIKYITNRINYYLPDKQIYYALGNHDMCPPNQFPPPEIKDPKFDAQWLYNLAVSMWGKSLPQSAKDSFREHGYYTVLVNSQLRVIALNSQFSYCLNWWLMYNPEDPHGQLSWLAKTLYQAEQNNQYCHIIGHIPVGSIDALYAYSRELWKILTRFSNTITGIYYGHTHYEQWNVLYDYYNVKIPLLPMMNAGSLTQYALVNSNYNVYDIETQSWSLLDVHCWIFNLTENKMPPRWFELYSFKEAYKMNSMNATEMDGLIYRMARDKSLMEKYDFYYSKGAWTEVVTKCDDECKRDRLREIVTNNYLDDRKWKDIEPKIKW